MLFHSCFCPIFKHPSTQEGSPSHLWQDSRGGYGEEGEGSAQEEWEEKHRRGEEEHSTVTDLLPPITCHIPSVRLSGRPAVHRDPGPSFIQRVGF